MAQNVFGDLLPGQQPAQAPRAPSVPVRREDPVIAPPDPYKASADRRAENADARAAASEGREAERLRLAREEADRQVRQDQVGTESERTAGFLAGRIVDAVGRLARPAKGNLDALAPSLGTEVIRGVAGDRAANYATDTDRQQVRAAQLDILDAALTLGTGAAYNREQLESYREAYFPQLGDAPETIASKNDALRSLLVNARIKAGRAAPEIDRALAELDAISKAEVAPKNEDPAVYDEQGNFIGLRGSVTDDTPDPETQKLIRMEGDQSGAAGLSTLAKQGITLGLSDEAAGVGGFLSAYLTGKDPTQEYFRNRDAQRAVIENARRGWPIAGRVAEFVGGAASGGSLLRGANALLTVGQAARQGAGFGALAGFGYGDGANESVRNALIGGAIGGGIGAGGQALGNAFAGRSARLGQAEVDRATRAQMLSNAGQAEGITVNRAMVDEALQNTVTGVDSTLIAGPRIQRAMGEIEGQIEGRVQNLGQGGTPIKSDLTKGDKVAQASERFIEKTGKAANAKYNRAEQLAGNAAVTPRESLSRVDDMIATLSETPGTNKAEIAFLQEIKSDLSKNLSVGALRRMRTSLRQKISKGELTFGEDEARVLAIMDGAADDIRAGLTAQGKTAAANAFDAADKAYRARMDYINTTIQPLIGKRNANFPAEKIAARFENMAQNDARGLRRFYASLTPEERADVSATFAEALGKNNKGNFSVSHFLRQSENFSPESLRTIFGAEGAESIANLRILGKEVERVTGAMNSRTSKSGVAVNYRNWLIDGLLASSAAGGGLAVGSGGTALAAGGGVLAIKGARDLLNARMLTNTNFTKWLRNAPATTNPRAIDSHFAKLGNLARTEPAIAAEITAFRDGLLKAVNDNAGRAISQSPGSAAAEDETDSRRIPPQQ